MKLSLIILGSPYGSQSPTSALAFARAAIDSGHQIYRVFFYHDGVYTASKLSISPQDEKFPGEEWANFAQQQQLDLVVCISAASRRGIMDQQEAERHELTHASLKSAYEISGLGQYIDAAIQSDRLITFGN
ncbi:MAG: sulfurtransferase complex subunit TusD [Pseudomonadales bacterium]